MTETTCRRCQVASHALRRLGFLDNFAWGVYPDAPTKVVHASCANSPFSLQQPPDRPPDGLSDEERAKWLALSPEVKAKSAAVASNRRVSLCIQFSSELAWLVATRPTRVVVYMAHPVSGPNFDDNIQNAGKWLRYLRSMSHLALNEMVGFEYQQRPLILAPWLAAVGQDWDYPGGREAVIADSVDTVAMFDEVWLLNRITEGMRAEASVAKVLRDLTHLGPSPGKNRTTKGKPVVRPKSNRR